jgi:hypothetical protein
MNLGISEPEPRRLVARDQAIFGSKRREREKRGEDNYNFAAPLIEAA